jgi:hypothetical protein
MFVVVCYDIADDRRRNRIAALLEENGSRAQERLRVPFKRPRNPGCGDSRRRDSGARRQDQILRNLSKMSRSGTAGGRSAVPYRTAGVCCLVERPE